MKTLQEMLNDAGHRWSGLAARAGSVSISGMKSGFRPGWKVPDPSFYQHEGVQEVLFVTHGDTSNMGTNYLKDGTSYTKPYRTLFRFPLEQSTGQPYPAGAGLNIPTYVSCSCPAFRFFCERQATDEDSSDITFSNGGAYRVNTPTYICKHLVATSRRAVAERPKVGTGVTGDTKGQEPKKVQPKRRDPMRPVRPAERSDSVNPETRKVSATSAYSLPQTWLGRIMYILFNERTGR